MKRAAFYSLIELRDALVSEPDKFGNKLSGVLRAIASAAQREELDRRAWRGPVRKFRTIHRWRTIENHNEHVKAYSMALVRGIKIAKMQGLSLPQLLAKSELHRGYPHVNWMWRVVEVSKRWQK